MISKRILLVGVGQLGSRYLQGLARVKQPLEIWLSDPSQDALKLALSRWHEVVSPNSNHQLHSDCPASSIPLSYDVIIVATSSKVRPDLVHQMSKKYHASFWILEKFLLNPLLVLTESIFIRVSECLG